MKAFLSIVCGGILLSTLAAAADPPKPRSQAEVEALRAAFAATDTDAQIAAAQNVLDKFADTQFKSILLELIASDYEKKNDFAKSVTYGEQALASDPSNYQAMITLGRQYATNTHDSDFDMKDKLKKANDYANNALKVVATAEKPNPSIPDQQWADAKKEYTAEAQAVIGQAALVKKDAPAAAAAFQAAIDSSPQPEPIYFARLAQADNMAGKYDDAIAAAEKAMNAPNAGAQIKQFAQAERARAVTNKSKGGAAAPSGSGATANAPAGAAPTGTPPASAPPASAPPPQ